MATSTRMIRYRTKPEYAEENERLIRDVYAELAAENPDGLQYATFRLEDGVSFVHVAVTDDEKNPLTSSPAFAAFQADIGERLAEGPTPAVATVVGNFGLLKSARASLPGGVVPHPKKACGPSVDRTIAGALPAAALAPLNLGR